MKELNIDAIEDEARSMDSYGLRGQHSNSKVIRLCEEIRKLREFKASVARPVNEQALIDAAFLRQLAKECREEMRECIEKDYMGAARVCHDRIKRLKDLAYRIESAAGLAVAPAVADQT